VFDHVIDDMVLSSMNVDVQVADGELIMGDGNMLREGSTRASKENYKGKDSSRLVDRMLERDIKLLEEQGFEVRKLRRKARLTRSSLIKDSGSAVTILCN
jgi:hypothetical protein